MFPILFVLFLFIPGECSPTTLELLFANRRDLRSVTLTPTNLRLRHNTTTLLPHLRDATSLDYDRGTLCYSDIKTESISCGSEPIATNLPAPEDIAIDWVCRNVYWTDSETNRIEVVGMAEPYYRRVLVWEELDQPRAIVLDSNEGLMFWSDWGEVARVERAGMDGGGRRTLISTSIVWPNGLALDLSTRTLYWIDGKMLQIGYSDYDGGRRGRLEGGTSLHPFSLTFHGGLLFWSDWNSNSLHYLQPNTTTPTPRPLQLRTTNLQPMDVVVKVDRLKRRECPACSHLTLLNPTSHSCTCPTGAAPPSCAPPSVYLLIARSTEVRKLSLLLNDGDGPDIPLPINGLKHVLSIDEHASNIYYTDDELRVVGCHGNNGSRVLITEEIIHPDGLAIDHSASQLYWTDAGTDKIEVVHLIRKHRRAVITKGLQEPRALALDTTNGYLFWSDWGKRPRLERSHLDGSGRVTILSTELEWPNGIALSIEKKLVYFCDASTDRIESIGYDGNNRVLIVSNTPHPFGFAYYAPYIYWSDWQSRSIERIHEDGSGRVSLLDPFPDPMGLRIVQSEYQLNGCSASGCDHLCFYIRQEPHCSCANGYELIEDERTCSELRSYIVYNRNGEMARMGPMLREEIIPVSRLRQPVNIAVDSESIYWSDRRAIYKSDLRGWGVEKVLDVQHPESIHIHSALIYWAEGGRVEVAGLDAPHFRRVILTVPDVKSVTVGGEYIYYSVWGRETWVGRAGVDGAGGSIYFKTSGRVNGLIFDMEYLYYANVDGGTVERYSNGAVEVVARGGSPYSVAVWGTALFYSDLGSNKFIKLDSNTSTTLATDVEILDIALYKPGPARAKCNCTHLCIGDGCGCPTHFKLERGACTGPDNYLLLAAGTSVYRVLDDIEVLLVSGLKKSRSRRVSYTNNGEILTSERVGFEEFVQVSGLIYYSTGAGINCSSSTDWSGAVRLVQQAKNLATDGVHIFYTYKSSIQRIGLDGLGLVAMDTGVEIGSLSIYKGAVYYYAEGGFYRAGLELGSYKYLFGGVEGVVRFALYGDEIWCVLGSGGLEVVGVDGEGGRGRRRFGAWSEASDVFVVEPPPPPPTERETRCSHIHLPATTLCSCPMDMALLQDGMNCGPRPGQCPTTLPWRCLTGPVACVGGRCDGVAECRDGSDEAECCGGCENECGEASAGAPTCPPCFTALQRCDSVPHCPNGFDEEGCPSTSAAFYIAIPCILILVLITLLLCRRRRHHANRSRLRHQNQPNHNHLPYTPQPTMTTLLAPTTTTTLATGGGGGGCRPPPTATPSYSDSELPAPPPSPHTSGSFSSSSKYGVRSCGGGSATPGAPPPSPVL